MFSSVTIEFLPTGLLPEIAAELGVSQSQVGLLITIFAGTVVLSTAPLANLTRQVPRKPLVLIVLLVFVLSSVMSALAPNYAVLVVARVFGGLAHGLFWAVVGAYSGHLVHKTHLARAVALTSGGGTTAFVLGVPLGTAIGHALGWRAAFLIMAGVILILAAVAAWLLPAVNHLAPLMTGEIPLPMRKDPSIPGIILICVVVVVIITAHNVLYTYVAPFLLGPVGIPSQWVALVLFLYGSAAFVGLVLSGIFAQRYPRGAISVALGSIVVSVVVIGLFPSVIWVVFPALVVWSIGFGAVPAMIQTRLLHTVSARLRDFASAYMTTSFNIGIGAGALLGALLLAFVSVDVLPFVNAALTLVALVGLTGGDRYLDRRAALR
jgi:DHA1 family inner membrane transport protein